MRHLLALACLVSVPATIATAQRADSSAQRAETSAQRAGGSTKPAALAVHWEGKPCPIDEVTARLGAGASDTLLAWEPFAIEHRYEAHLAADGQVALLLPERARNVKRSLALAAATAKRMDELLAVDAEEAALGSALGALAGGLGGEESGCGEGCGEGEGEDAEGEGEGEESGETEVLEPEDEGPRLAVMVDARDEKDYASVLDHCATLAPYLAEWLPSAKKLTGFTLVEPLVSAWAATAANRVEWDPENEFVHRLAHLTVLQRFGEQPYWLVSGIAWFVEIGECGDVYCFPYRDEFVWATEHTAWPNELRRAFDGPREPFLPDLVAWRRGTFDAARAREAFGMVRFIANERPGAMGLVLADFAALRREHGVVRHEDGTWEVIVGWEPTLEQQRAVFSARLGADFEQAAVESFKRKPSKR